MGAVYLGQHTLLGRRAAIKVLLPALSARTDIINRFFNEARAVTSISDLGIVQVFDFGYHSDGSAFLVMEFLEGEPLDRRLARLGRLAVHDALRLCRQVASSLAAAHAQHIVHRDLKPENIFLVPDGEAASGERSKILDFGIAKLSDEHPGKVKTHTGALMGTPTYMSPEQCRGIAEIDHRSDIYALGCVLFHLLVGRPPFEGEGTGDIIAAHIREPAPAPSSRALGIPPRVDALVLRCLAKAPPDRFQTMVEVAGAIGSLQQEMLAGAPAHVAPAYHSLPTAKVQPAGALPSPVMPGSSAPPFTRVPPTTFGVGAGQFAPTTPRPRQIGLWIAGFFVLGAAVTGIAVVGTRNDKPKDKDAVVMPGAGTNREVLSDAGDGAVVGSDHPNPPMGPNGGIKQPNGSGSGIPIAVTQPRSPCDTMDVEDTMKQAANQYSAGYAKAALALVVKALGCKQNEMMYRMAGMYACAAHDLTSAKTYFAKVPVNNRAAIEQKCVLEGLIVRGDHPDSDIVANAAVTTNVAKPDDEKAQKAKKCTELQATHKWQELSDCAKALDALGFKDGAKEFQAKAVKEQGNELTANELGSALRDRDLKKAESLLAKIGDGSVYYKNLHDQFVVEETAAVEEAKRKAQGYANAHDCTTLKRYVTQQVSSSTERVAAAVQAVKCTEKPQTPDPPVIKQPSGSGSGSATPSVGTPPAKNLCEKMNVDDVVTQAQNQFNAGYAKSALSVMQKALACKQDTRMYRLAVTYACAARDLASAKLYFAKVPKENQTALEQKCVGEGLNIRGP